MMRFRGGIIEDAWRLWKKLIRTITTMLDKFPLVIIAWEDSSQPVAAWQHLADMEKPSVVKCESVGWLIHDGDDVKSLAPNMGDADSDNAQASGVICIPARSVLNVVTLAELEK